ncbi:L-cysteine desulfidase family protein [Celerinatantimonas yamalensis]|uniref:UPF0597 protein ABUE30_12235 n=1 Tax=Celerinatantimonas yamalensis TaxID=559956 RepID=A0ABW9G8F5_9GAMM
MSATIGYLDTLKRALKPALGCTEPLTVALAAAHARHHCPGALLSMQICVSANLFKNAAGVFVPGTGMTGLAIAAATGWFCGNSEAGLEVLAKLSPEGLDAAKQLIDKQQITLNYIDHDDVFYTCLEVTTDQSKAKVVMGQQHDGVLSIEVDGQCCYQDASNRSAVCERVPAEGWSVRQIVEFITQVDLAELHFIEQSATLNQALSDVGLTEKLGLAVGASLYQQQQAGWLSDDLASRAMILSASASDARMAGAPMAAMSNSGSGNQGIAATMPVVAVAQILQVSNEQRLRALAMSHLLAVYIKKMQSPLSALCAATTAAMGSAAAINWLLGGDVSQIEQTIRYMIGDISGIYCDGAKPGCALKVSTGASAAVKAALLGLNGGSARSDGMLESSVDDSLRNLGELTWKPLQATDQQIVRWIAARQ